MAQKIHGQSWDWLYEGDPLGLICGAARRSPQAAALPGLVDPIFGAIEQHRRAVVDYKASAADELALEEQLPPDECLSDITWRGETIVEGDDPRWITAQRQRKAADDAMEMAAIALVNIRLDNARRRRGAPELLYAEVTATTDYGCCFQFPEYLSDDDDPTVRDKQRGTPFGYFIARNVAGVLGKATAHSEPCS